MTTAEARKRSLQIANQTRLERRAQVAELQTEWRDLSCVRARKRLADLLLDPPPIMAAMEVERVLLACKSMGPVKADKILTAARITTGKLCVRDIDPIRRDLLARAVAGEHIEPEDDIVAEVETLRAQVGILRAELKRVREAAA